MNVMGWVLLALFLALLVAGSTGVLLWAVARPSEDRLPRTGVVAASLSVAVVSVIGAILVAAWGPGSRGGGIMRDMGAMAGMMGQAPTGNCRTQRYAATSATIDGFRYCPGTIRVPAGTEVRWTNRDSAAHTVTSRGESERFDSGRIGRGHSWSHRFDTAGTFAYYCTVHPWMEGTVDVTA